MFAARVTAVKQGVFALLSAGVKFTQPRRRTRLFYGAPPLLYYMPLKEVKSKELVGASGDASAALVLGGGGARQNACELAQGARLFSTHADKDASRQVAAESLPQRACRHV